METITALIKKPAIACGIGVVAGSAVTAAIAINHYRKLQREATTYATVMEGVNDFYQKAVEVYQEKLEEFETK